MNRRVLFSGLLIFALMIAVVPARASAAPVPPGAIGPQSWSLTMTAWPTVFAPGAVNETYYVVATNVGGATTSGITTIKASLAPGLTYESAEVEGGIFTGTCAAVGQDVSCEIEAEIAPGEQLLARINVAVDAAAVSPLQSGALVEGGGTSAPVTASTATPVGAGAATAGIAPGSFFSRTSNSQAGAHPNASAGFILTTTRHQESNGVELVEPAGSLKDVLVSSPPGLIGSAAAAPKCNFAQFATNSCPADSKVGVEALILNTAGGGVPPGGRPFFTGSTPVYNLTPSAGVPAQFGFRVLTISVIIRAKLRTGGDYGLDLDVGPNSQGGTLFASTTTFYGTPAKYNGGGATPTPQVYSPTNCGPPQQASLTLGFYPTPVRDWRWRRRRAGPAARACPSRRSSAWRRRPAPPTRRAGSPSTCSCRRATSRKG